MAKYGNNKGKKYVKLQGGEVATRETLARARAFMGWYGLRCDELRRIIHNYDDEVATDTAISIYDAIALKGLIISGKYKWYFVRAYHINYIAAQKKLNDYSARHVDIELAIHLEAAADGAEIYEGVVNGLRSEVLEYVRANYAPADVSLFEIYVELQPEMSYKKLAAMLGYPVQKIWPAIGAIKKGVAEKFGARKDFLLSHI